VCCPDQSQTQLKFQASTRKRGSPITTNAQNYGAKTKKKISRGKKAVTTETQGSSPDKEKIRQDQQLAAESQIGEESTTKTILLEQGESEALERVLQKTTRL